MKGKKVYEPAVKRFLRSILAPNRHTFRFNDIHENSPFARCVELVKSQTRALTSLKKPRLPATPLRKTPCIVLPSAFVALRLDPFYNLNSPPLSSPRVHTASVSIPFE